MIKNNTFTATICETRNTLADAIKRKDPVIVIRGNAYKEFKKEAEKGYKQGGIGKAAGAGLGVASLSLIPGVGPAFALLGGATVLLKAFDLSKSDFKNYRYSFYKIASEPCMILVLDSRTSKTFKSKYDTISTFPHIKFAEKCKCVSCEEKLDKKKYNNFEPCVCKKCGAVNLRLYKR